MASLVVAGVLIPASSRADGPDWPFTKGESAICGTVVSFKAPSKLVVVNVKFQLAPDSHRAGYGWWNERGSYVGKRLTIDLSHTMPKKTVSVKDSHGITDTIRLGVGKWSDPTAGSFFTVYFPTPKHNEAIKASVSTSDSP